MAKINLLPWRDEYRQEKQREFIVIMCGVAFAAATASFFWVNSYDLWTSKYPT